jgi:hypothetical protein
MFIPVITEIKYDSANTPKVIAQVLMNPFVVQIKWILPVTKIILLAVIVAVLLLKKNSEKIILSYYAIILVVLGVLQNAANTKYGFSLIVGNLIVQFVVCTFVCYDLVKGKSQIHRSDFEKRYCLLIPFMLLAFLLPYTMKNGLVAPSLIGVLTNEAGVTYCMVTPVVTGMLLLFGKQIHKPTLNAISFVGFAFGLINMITWFVMDIPNWWMGICHIPLLVISFVGLLNSKNKK